MPGLPTIHFAGQVLIGYQGDHITGAEYESLIRRVSGEDQKRPNDKPREGDTSAMGRGSSSSSAIRLVSLWNAQTPEEQTPDTQTPEEQTPEEQSSETQNPAEQSSEASSSAAPPIVDGERTFDDLPLPDEADLSDLGEAESIPQETQNEPVSDSIDVPVLGELSVSDLGLPLFTFLVGLVDGFNPCAMWVLVFLLSVLVNIKDRRKILLIAGTFVVVSGIAYFAFMAAWLNLFMLIGIARPAQIVLGLIAILIGAINVKDFFAFKKGISLSIPESRKPGLYKRVREIVAAKYLSAALAGVIALAVIVNMIELLCTAGLPALYTQILTMHELPAWQNYCYLALYIAAYMLDDTILLAIVVATLSHRRLQEREGRWLKLLSGLVILVLGLTMIFRPSWLTLGQ